VISDQRTLSSKGDLKLNIGWLYPKQMSTYGDRGNVLSIWKRSRWRNIQVNVREIDLKEKIDPARFDLFFFGGGQDQAQKIVSDDLIRYKKDDLFKASRLGSVFLGICGGYQLLGNYYQPSNDQRLPGLGLLDIVTIAGNNRMIGNIVIEKNNNLNFEGKLLVGFENHSGKTYLGKKASPMGKVIVGYGNNGEDRTEGAYQGNIFGCYLHGPLLPKNPRFADFLILRSLKRKHKIIELTPLEDTLENLTHKSSIDRTQKGIN